MKRPRDGNVYFLQVKDCDLNFIKIGFTQGLVRKRVQQLLGGSPFDLVWIGAFRGVPTDERDLHRRFKSAAIRCEWFRPVPELVDFIRDTCPNFDAQKYETEIHRDDLKQKVRERFNYRTKSRQAFLSKADIRPHDFHHWLEGNKALEADAYRRIELALSPSPEQSESAA